VVALGDRSIVLEAWDFPAWMQAARDFPRGLGIDLPGSKVRAVA
jgi:hypothetical protein